MSKAITFNTSSRSLFDMPPKDNDGKPQSLFVAQKKQNKSTNDLYRIDESPNKGANRYRKNHSEMDLLKKVYRQLEGKMPKLKQRRELAKELDMKESQVYKWFWEIRQKQKDLNEMLSEPILKDINEMTELEKFEIFVNKDLKQYRKRITLDGKSLSGRPLSREEMI